MLLYKEKFIFKFPNNYIITNHLIIRVLTLINKWVMGTRVPH